MEEVTIGWIRNSLELGFLALTANLREQIEANSNLQILSEMEWPFDLQGNLPVLPTLASRAGAK